ncbi:hypothetical protein CWO84_23350 [Methylomonas sp. Kb3]|uniref:LA2681 family HEPN domain-containing protein n=2 Tax=unclassified Methylomonas TaxID=2608980 RepID=UPI000C336625|nr:LA2681 family HEPN domain-containing protein [Methylomonas sp. Kb3]PKD38164.1 hypothetical protein CWO84_23350 [Methylomonas sp. Kb3]
MKLKLEKLASWIDTSIETEDIQSLNSALANIESFDRKTLTDLENATLDFYTANVFSCLRQASNDRKDFAWANPNVDNEIYFLRSALNYLRNSSTREIGTDLKLRITTNLANVLNHVGRFTEAIEYWDQAISDIPEFSMAIGNRGMALFWYSRFIEDPETQALFLKSSRVAFCNALSLGVENHAKAPMLELLEHLNKLANWDELNPGFSIFGGEDELEKAYRKWCVQHRLVLNQANDLSSSIDGLQDTLTLPSIVTNIREKPEWLPVPYAIFNQLKQEFVSARFLLFEATREQDLPLHFSDYGIILYDTLDYRFYRLWIEKLKMAFLSAHTILDKVAYIINEYWEIGHPIHKVDFNSVWFFGKGNQRKLIEKFTECDNWPLRGLFSLSRDFYYQKNADRPLDPEAKLLHDIRNHIAHKYLRVHVDDLYNAEDDRSLNGLEISFPITEIELTAQTIKLLKLVRSTLIYLTAAVAHEESKRTASISSGMIAHMPIIQVEDIYRN